MTTPALRVVQVYSEKRGAQIAAEACDRLRSDFDAPGWAETTWNTELLRSPKLRLMAAREAAVADIVVIAVDEGIPLSQEIVQWLQLWRRRCRTRKSTLVALLRREDATVPTVVQASLERFAVAAKMDFFCHSQVNPRNHRWIEVPLPFLP